MTTTTDVIAIEKEHLLQVYRRGSGGVRSRPRLPPVRRQRPQLSRPDLRRRRRRARARASAPRRGDRGSGAAAAAHVEPVLPSAAGRARRRVSSTLSGLPRAFFCNSGAEAVEASLKFARRYWHAQGQPRSGFVAFEHSFHGRTMGALSVTWDDHYRAPFKPLIPGVTFVAADDIDGAAGGGDGSHGRGDRRADTRGRRRPADQRRHGRRDRRRVRPHRRAAHRRRSAVRARPDGPCRSIRRRWACSRT